MKHFASVALAAALLAGPSYSASTGFTDFVGFGDSLSDKGRIPSTPFTSPPQLGGRFSDGPTWMEQVGQRFEDRGGANINMSLGGATAGANRQSRIDDYVAGEAAYTGIFGQRDSSNPDDIPFEELQDFNTQIATFLSGPSTSAVGGLAQRVGDNPLVAVLLGGNDFLALPSNPTNTEVAAVVTSAITALSTGIQTLASAGTQFDDFMVGNFLGSARFPASFNAPQSEKDANDALVSQFNALLAGSMATLASNLSLGLGRTINIEIYDAFSAFNTAHAAGLAGGLIGDSQCLGVMPNPVDLSLPGIPFNNCPNPGDSDDYLFLDDIHPNSFIQNGMANAALSQLEGRIAPVPLPAGGILLIGGLSAFAALRRTRGKA